MRSLLLTVLGAYHLALGASMALAPRRFYDDLAGFGPYNEHFVRDLATPNLALGAVLLIAARRRSWQVPVLAFAVVQYALHLVNHLIDLGDSDPGWHGPFTAASLAALTALLGWTLRRAALDSGRADVRRRDGTHVTRMPEIP